MREFQHKNLNFKLRNERSRTRCWPKFIRWECSTFLPHFEELLHNFAPWNWKWIFSSLASLPFWNFRFSCGREDDNFPGFFLLFTSLHPLAPNRWSLFLQPRSFHREMKNAIKLAARGGGRICCCICYRKKAREFMHWKESGWSECAYLISNPTEALQRTQFPILRVEGERK